MTDTRKANLGELSEAVSAAVRAYATMCSYPPTMKAEILSLLHAMVTIVIQRESRARVDADQQLNRALSASIATGAGGRLPS